MERKALVVDDSGVLRQVCTMTLARNGFEVTAAEDGLKALEIALEESFDVVVTDINMPVMDGIELIRRLRDLDHFKYTPIVVLSTLSEETKLEQGKAVGASGWLFKPFSGAQLMSAVRKLT